MKIKGIAGALLAFVAAALSDCMASLIVVAPLLLVSCVLMLAAIIEDMEKEKRAKDSSLDAPEGEDIA